LCSAILAVRQQSMTIFASTKLSPAWDSLDRGNCCISEDNFCRFIGHIVARLQKDSLYVDCAETHAQSIRTVRRMAKALD